MASAMATATKVSRTMFRELHGVVVTSGLIDKTVKVRVGGQKFNKFLQKVCTNANNPTAVSQDTDGHRHSIPRG